MEDVAVADGEGVVVAGGSVVHQLAICTEVRVAGSRRELDICLPGSNCACAARLRVEKSFVGRRRNRIEA